MITQIVKRYRYALLLMFINITIALIVPEKGIRSFTITKDNLLEMLSFIPPIFVLLGLLDVWVDREKFTRHMGPESGIKGTMLAILLGTAAAGPLYVAFPIAGMLIRKGTSLLNVFIFIGAWSTIKLPMTLFEASSIGLKYTLIRLVINSAGIFAIAFLLDKTTSQERRETIYAIENIPN